MEKDIPCNRNQKKAGVAILISDKIDFKIKTIIRGKEGHYIMIKGSIQESGITIVNMYAPNIGGPQYIRQILTAIKGEIDFKTKAVTRDKEGHRIMLNLRKYNYCKYICTQHKRT